MTEHGSSPRGRLVAVDATRGLALLGMMAVHVFPGLDPDGTVSATYLLASGRAAATFAVLAGVGLALAFRPGRPPTGRSGPVADAAALLVRAALVGAVGLALAPVESGVAVILAYYALLFVLAVPLLRLPTPVLAGAAVACAVVVPFVSAAVRRSLPAASGANPAFSDLVERPGALLTELALTGYYPALAWLTYLCAGLAVGRLDLRSGRVAGALLAVGAGLAVGAALASSVLLDVLGGRAAILAASPGVPPERVDALLERSAYGTTPTTTDWWLASDAPHSSTPLDLLHTTGTAIALLGAVLLLARAGRAVALALTPLAAAGSMTLTLYTAHVLALAWPGLPADPAEAYLVQVVAALVLATAWRTAVGRGPLEAAVAALSRSAARATRLLSPWLSPSGSSASPTSASPPSSTP